MIGGQTLTDGVIVLREIAPDDIARLYEWRNDPATRPMFRDDRPLEFAAHSRFVRDYWESGGAAPKAVWLIIEAEGIPVGTISLYGFRADGRECEFGRFIVAPGHRGCGYGRRALELILTLAASRGVRRISCEVLGTNAQAMRLYGGFGFARKETTDCGPRSFVRMEAELEQA